LSAILGSTAGLKTASLKIGQTEILYGDFLAVTIDFIVIALVVYYGVKIIGVGRLDKKKE
jgi:large-conductance mechanosensitive channel